MPKDRGKKTHVVYMEHYYEMDNNAICGIKVDGVWDSKAAAEAFAKDKITQHASRWDAEVKEHKNTKESRYWIENPKRQGADNFVWVVRETDYYKD